MTRTRWSAVAVATLLALSACSSDPDTEPTDNDDEPQAVEAADIRLWINGADTPDAAREWLTEAFAEANPGSTVTIEEQQWEGLVERLTTSLSSESETPDVVEVGNTQAATFTTAGAFSDLSDRLDDFGGDDLLAGFVEAGSAEGKTYAVPYYAGSKFVFYRKDLFEASGLEVPTTMEEFVDAAVTLKEDKPNAGELLRVLAAGPGLAQRRHVRLGRRRRPCGRGRRAVAGRALEPRVGGWAGDRPTALRRGVRRGQGRQRSRSPGRVLHR